MTARARHAHVLRRSPGQPRRRRVGAGRRAAVPAVEHPPVAVGRRPPLAGPARRGRRRRRSRPADAHRRPRRRVDRAPRRRPAARPRRRRPGAPVGTARYRVCSTRARSSTTTASRSRRRARPRGSTSTATSRPGGAPVCAGPATTRCRSRRSTPSSGPSSPAPTCAATTPSTPAAACCCARRRRSPTRRCRRATCGRGSSSGRSARRLTGLPGALRVRGLHVGQGRDDERGRRRLGLRAPRRVLVDDGVLGRHPRRHRHASSRRTSGTSARPTSRRWPCCAGSTSTPPAQFVDWYPFEHPQLGAVELGGWPYLGIWTNPPPNRLQAEVARRTPRSPSPGDRRRRVWRSATPQVVDLGGGTWRIEVGVANSGWLPTQVVGRAAKRATSSGRSWPRSRATASPWSAGRRACSSASSPATARCASRTARRHARPPPGDVGRAGRARRRGRPSSVRHDRPAGSRRSRVVARS